MTKIHSMDAMNDLIRVVKTWNTLDDAGINDLYLQTYTLLRNSYAIEAEAEEWDTVREVVQILRDAKLLIKGKAYKLFKRQSSRRRRACVDIPLPNNGKLTIYAKNDCFDEEKKSDTYLGYTGLPDCAP